MALQLVGRLEQVEAGERGQEQRVVNHSYRYSGCCRPRNVLRYCPSPF